MKLLLMSHARRLAIALFVIILLPWPASATTYVRMKDADLAGQSPLIVVGRIDSVEPAGTDRPATDYGVGIERVLKGQPGPGPTVVRVPGGMTADGRVYKVFGAPSFEQGDRVILFLFPRADGTYGIAQLMLGAFREVRQEGGSLAVRDLGDATEFTADGSRMTGRSEVLRDFDRFSDWLATAAEPDYEVGSAAEVSSRRTTGAFTFFNPAGRWFEFDTGVSVEWRAHVDGEDGMEAAGLGGGFAQFQAALQAWNNDTGSFMNLTYGGTTTSEDGLSDFGDDINAVLWNDESDEIGGSFSCSSGGACSPSAATLPRWRPALSTARPTNASGRRHRHPGRRGLLLRRGRGEGWRGGARARAGPLHRPHPLVRRDRPLQRGAKTAALMRAVAHGDGRGAQLGSDDRAAIAVLYGLARAGGDRSHPGATVPRAHRHRDLVRGGRRPDLRGQRREHRHQLERVQRVRADSAISQDVTLPSGNYRLDLRACGPFSTCSPVTSVTFAILLPPVVTSPTPAEVIFGAPR